MRKALTIRELEHIRASFHTQSDEQLAKELGRTAASVAQIRFKYRLIKGKSTKQKAPDEFHVKRSVGCKPYLNIKIGRKWVSYHRHLWEQAHGPIPAGLILAFKNGNTMDCRLDNLELLTRAENL